MKKNREIYFLICRKIEILLNFDLSFLMSKLYKRGLMVGGGERRCYILR